jgi:conjugal transfer pilus assembly protein TraV
MTRVLISLLILLFVSGCAGVKEVVNPYEEDFRCRTRDEAGTCLDTAAAYQEARLPDNPEGEATAADALAEAQDSRYRVLAELLEEPETPLLQPPKVLRVLLLPYRGEDNELFMTRYAFLEVERAQWVLTEMRER